MSIEQKRKPFMPLQLVSNNFQQNSYEVIGTIKKMSTLESRYLKAFYHSIYFHLLKIDDGIVTQIQYFVLKTLEITK